VAQLPAGAVTAYQYGGGAGFEDPLLRDPEAVREDVLDEYVSMEAARARYGVALHGSVEEGSVAVDREATQELRRQLAAARRKPA
jgi:N-methylhydantoinase B